tara:strand:- start:1829 stop:2302 length:474 start_codon:yes stop_codon:yes gene_type:complete
MRDFSAAARENLLATSASEPFFVLLEITHADLAVPVRVVNDTQNMTSNGVEFIGCPFNVTLPDDVAGQMPSAQLEVDNIGRDLTQWLEFSRGGQGARCRIMQVMRSDPDTVEFDMTLDLTNMKITNETVSGSLGFENMLNRTGTIPTFTPQNAPGLW